MSPLKASQLIISDEKWASMSEVERLRAITDGRLGVKLMRQILQNGSEAEMAAVREVLSREENAVDSLTKRMAAIGGGLRNAFAEIDDLMDRQHADLFRPIKVDLPRVKMDRIPSASEINSYASARVLINRLKERYRLWSEQLPENVQPAIYALLTNGVLLKASSFEEEGHNGIAIYGEISGTSGNCLVITHQAGLQIFCMVEEVAQKNERRTIGFVTAEGEG